MTTKHAGIKELLAIIPARAVSTRLRGKNTRLFCGKPLIAYSIIQAKKHPLIDRVIVDTESPEIAQIAKQYGAEVPYLRPERLATAIAEVSDAVLLLLRRLKKEEQYEPTHIVLLQPTSPLRAPEDIQACWDAMQTTGAPRVFTVFQTVITPIPNGGVYLLKTSVFLKEKKIYRAQSETVLVPRWRSVDIDDAEDFVVGEYLYRARHLLTDRITSLR